VFVNPFSKPELAVGSAGFDACLPFHAFTLETVEMEKRDEK
jgi:hypothetical protein